MRFFPEKSIKEYLNRFSGKRDRKIACETSLLSKTNSIIRKMGKNSYFHFNKTACKFQALLSKNKFQNCGEKFCDSKRTFENNLKRDNHNTTK